MYKRKPDRTFYINFEDRPCKTLKIDWDELLKHKTTPVAFHDITCKADSAQHDHLAILIRHIGFYCSAKYDSTTTSVTGDEALFRSRFFLYGASETYVTDGNFYDHLEDDGVAVVCGVDYGANGGHAWVLDGVASAYCKTVTYTRYNPRTGAYETKEIKEETLKYLHCNWGWYGDKNGYFLQNVFYTLQGKEFDKPPVIGPLLPVDPWEPYEPTSRSDHKFYFEGVIGYVFKDFKNILS